MERTRGDWADIVNGAYAMHGASFRDFIDERGYRERLKEHYAVSAWLVSLPEGEADALYAQFVLECTVLKETS